MVKIDDLAPEFETDAFVNNEIRKVKLSDYRGKWVVLFFYPADFTFVCPTEPGDVADYYEQREFSKVVREVMDLADLANQYIAEQEPWVLVRQVGQEQTVQDICSTGINLFRILMIYLNIKIKYQITIKYLNK